MYESCWDILGIGITTDKLEIKKAFAKLAHQTSPEDDPDGYRRIHTAYKQALAFASRHNGPMQTNAPQIPGPGITISRRNPSFQFPPATLPEEKKEPEEEKDKDAFDFTSVEMKYPDKKSKNLTKYPSSHIRPQIPKKPEEKKQRYDFSPITHEEQQFSDEIEKIIEQIVTYKEENGIDTPENIKRWKVTTLETHGMKLFDLYGSLFRRSGEISTWNVFFKEPLMKRMLYNEDFRHNIRTQYPAGSESQIKIEELIEEFEDKLALAAAEQEEQQAKQNGKEQIVISCFVIFGVLLFLLLLSFLYFSNR